jgi:adenylate cyclase
VRATPAEATDLAREIERKFLVPTAPDWLAGCDVENIEQGYLAVEGDAAEVRIRRSNGSAWLTVKRGVGLERDEVEVGLDRDQSEALWPLTAGRRISKDRYRVPSVEGEIQVDVYAGALEGLVVAEVEFDEEAEPEDFDVPAWLGEEVTGDSRYANKNLAIRPSEVERPESGGS